MAATAALIPPTPLAQRAALLVAAPAPRAARALTRRRRHAVALEDFPQLFAALFARESFEFFDSFRRQGAHYIERLAEEITALLPHLAP